MKFVIAAIAAFIFLLGAFSRVLAAPTFSIVSPSQNQVIQGTSVTITFSVNDFSLTDYHTHSVPTFGQGHILLWLDQSSYSKSSAIKISTPSYTFTNLKQGSHILRAELVNNNHFSLAPQTLATLNFTTANSISISNNSSAFFGLLVLICILLATTFYLVDGERKSLTKPAPKKKSKK